MARAEDEGLSETVAQVVTAPESRPSAPRPAELLTGSLGRYKLQREIGSGMV